MVTSIVVIGVVVVVLDKVVGVKVVIVDGVDIVVVVLADSEVIKVVVGSVVWFNFACNRGIIFKSKINYLYYITCQFQDLDHD